MIIIMYKDIITNLKIPGIYMLLTGKNIEIYDLSLESIINILTENRKLELEVWSIITDTEIALIDTVKKYFPNVHRIGCFFHYKQDLIRNIKAYGLYKKEDKETSNYIIEKLSSLPFLYKGKLDFVNSLINKISNDYPKYSNFLNNYFLRNKLQYFKDQSLDYYRIPKDCRTNNFLENYNGHLKNN